jgi:hypothetical protein
VGDRPRELGGIALDLRGRVVAGQLNEMSRLTITDCGVATACRTSSATVIRGRPGPSGARHGVVRSSRSSTSTLSRWPLRSMRSMRSSIER